MSAPSEDDTDNMTLKEKEEWLRSRGVLIETPEDRKAAADVKHSVVGQMRGLTLAGNDSSIQFVCVPHDDSKPIQTLHLPESVAKAKPGDALPDFVKAYFADEKAIDATLLKEQATKHFAGGDLEALAEKNISSSAMNAVAAQGSVETFPLVHPADTNGFQGVYVYLDEVGLLKKLPNNSRASKIAEACGYHPAPSFYGDVFIGRVKTKPTLSNVDFKAGEDTDRGAPWMQRAIAENLAWQQEMNRVTGKEGQTQEAQIGTEGKAAVEDSFEWTQDEDELEIVVSDLADDKINKKALKVTFLSRQIKVAYEGVEKLNISLYGPIDLDGSTWTLDGGTKLVITCEKSEAGAMWPRIKN